jgi:hypothetical protein
VKQAIDLGREMMKAKGGGVEAVSNAICRSLGGEVVARGSVERVQLTSRGGFDVGSIMIEGGFEITFWNEYMTLEHQGNRIATFPDLIVTMDAQSAMPVTSAEIRGGKNVVVICVKKEKLKLGGGMKDHELLRACEEAVGKKMV